MITERKLDESVFTSRLQEARDACDELMTDILEGKLPNATDDTSDFVNRIEGFAERLRELIEECQEDLSQVNEVEEVELEEVFR
jgi:hypothetical protein